MNKLLSLDGKRVKGEGEILDYPSGTLILSHKGRGNNIVYL